MPIIQSLLDLDFYKFTMGQLVFLRYRDVPVTYALINRTRRVRLAETIDEGELREELDHVRSLRFNNSELHYLRGTNEYGDRMFCEEYLDFLRDLRLPEYDLEEVDGSFRLHFRGKWSEAIYWETIALSVVNELHNRSLMKHMSPFEKDLVLARGNFASRKRSASFEAGPRFVSSTSGPGAASAGTGSTTSIRTLVEEMPAQFLGTSSTESAMLHGLVPMGTSAHELYMVMSGIMHESDDSIRASHSRVVKDWWDLYGWGLSVAVTDTYGSEFFFRDMEPEQARAWKGLRHDSGDPIEFGERAIRFYQDLGIDPREKLIIFSDGLDLDRILELSDRFHDRVTLSFGWGTNLTNDSRLRSDLDCGQGRRGQRPPHGEALRQSRQGNGNGRRHSAIQTDFGHRHERAEAVRY